MAFSRVGAGGAGVILIETKAMRPTIIDLSAVVGGGRAGGNTGRQGDGAGVGRAGGVVAALAL